MNSRQSSDRLLDKLPKMSEEQLRTVVESLRRKDHLWQQLFDALVDGVVVINSSLNVLYANRAAREMLRWDAHKLTTKQRLPNLLPVGELASLVTRFALEPKPFTGVEIELPGPEPRWISVSILAVEKDLDNQEETRFVLVMHDTTELHRVEAERQRAERAMTLATLAAGLAHEIKNPLNSLQIHAQLLQRALRERAKKSRKPAEWSRPLQSCDIIVEEIARLSNVVNQFLAAVRPTRPLFQRANINYHIERVLETIRPEIETKGIRLDVRLDHEIPPHDFDPQQMTQVLLNILKNAMEAVEGCENPTISVRTALEDAGWYRISISDNGVGIPNEEVKARLFEAYYTTKPTGTGLGLAIVRRVIEDHGGEVWIDNNTSGRGSMVVMRFPLASPVRRLLGEPASAGREMLPSGKEAKALLSFTSNEVPCESGTGKAETEASHDK
ncbi:MAG: GHKL domain-containing protein [Candidatus Hydrogenedentota bacterium]|jgi:nitrogen fixation/metabolism regulation signal transduction histidine kinase|uniref:histidine kinase n=1 Tax=Sumerlaea chitinivorans TaxID=2250252 RepID=A0A2Z4Y8L9_SUMC1|nr:putative 2-component Histidine kinase-sensor [Candidatus Sumerlaea chitinivorans]RMH24073.1 MAG: GHKL domain-containing protein [Candidatus Hydrogenedentota bacterium]